MALTTKTILISVVTSFSDAALKSGVQQLKQQLTGLSSPARQASSAVTGLTNSFRHGSGILADFLDTVKRVGVGILTWRAFQGITFLIKEFTGALVGANISMQESLTTFTALARGNIPLAESFVEIARAVSAATGANFEQLLAATRRLPTQVGQNLQAFEQLSKIMVVLSRIDVQQGLEGAAIGISNALEGTAEGLRSLMRRFELGSFERAKQLLEEFGDPLVVITKLLEEAGINVDEFLAASENNFSTALAGITSVWREFLRLLGEPVIAELTGHLVNLRDWLRENQEAIFALGKAIGDHLLIMFRQLVTVLSTLLNFLFPGLAAAVKGLFSGLPEVAKETAEAARRATEAAGKAVTGSVSGIVSQLKSIGVTGKESVEQAVKGILDGLSSADLERVAAELVKSVVSEEALIEARERGVQQLEAWADEAEDAARQHRDKMRKFQIETEDIPERFTRAARRRQELAQLALEQEAAARKSALQAAKDALAVQKENLATQRQILLLVEQAAKQAEEEGAGGIDKGFVAADIDTAGFAARVEELRKAFFDKLTPFFDRIQGFFSSTLDFLKSAWDWISKIVGKISDILNWTDSFLAGLGIGWENLDPTLRTFLLWLALGIAPGVFGPLLISVAFKAAQAAAGALLNVLFGALAGAGIAGLALPALTLVLILEVVWGWPELQKWLTGERQMQLTAIIAVKATEGLNKLLEFFGADFTLDPAPFVKSVATVSDRINESVRERGVAQTVIDGLLGAAGEIGDAAKTAFDPITQWATDTYNAVVGQSIIPDMLTAIIDAFVQFPGQLQPSLVGLHETIMAEMHLLRDDWIMDWDQMAAAVQSTIDLQQRARELAMNRAARESRESPLRRDRPQELNVNNNLSLDARETRKLMEEGVYRGMARVAPGEA